VTLKSPCVDICWIDARTHWCAGCGRTIEEIKGWQKMTPFRQRVVLADLERRLSRLGIEAISPHPDLETKEGEYTGRR